MPLLLHSSRFATPSLQRTSIPCGGVASLARGARARQEGASTVARSLKLFSHNRKARGGALPREGWLAVPPSPSLPQIGGGLTNEADKIVHASSRNSRGINKRLPAE